MWRSSRIGSIRCFFLKVSYSVLECTAILPSLLFSPSLAFLYRNAFNSHSSWWFCFSIKHGSGIETD